MLLLIRMGLRRTSDSKGSQRKDKAIGRCVGKLWNIFTVLFAVFIVPRFATTHVDLPQGTISLPMLPPGTLVLISGYVGCGNDLGAA